ncbi:GNAT family N-acetyltransferase [Rhodopila sp.]|uniref:bifunctional acetate--CoA ligase family protein/GNAT family N-acetyltransferase n=1 Tax=Rhodopila sp. TaxID=2480087 RepID=UPI003D0F0EEE
MTVPRLHTAGRFDPAALFRPASVALIGAGTGAVIGADPSALIGADAGAVVGADAGAAIRGGPGALPDADPGAGAQILANLRLGGFNGAIHTTLVKDVSLAVLAVPPDQIGPQLTALAQANCFAAIVPGAADDLAGHSARTGVRILGPHSFGLAVPGLRLNASRSHIAPPPGRLALISQSSALCRTVIDWAGPNGVGFSHIVGLGGNAGIGFGATLDWLSRDPGTGAILLDIRRIKDHRLFLSAARAAARLRPVVALRAGLRLLDDDGEADLSFEAALRRAGVLAVKRLEDLLAAAETLSRARPARRDTLAIVSNAIGPGRLAADSVLRQGLQLRSDQAITPVASADLAATAFALAARPDIGGVLVVHAPQGAADAAAIANLREAPATLGAPLLVCAMGETTGAAHRTALARAGLPVFATPDQAVQGFDFLVRDRRNREAARELPPSAVLDLAPDRHRVRRLFDQARAQDRLALTQDQALEVLAAYGIPTVPTRVAATAQDAAAAAQVVGFPAVVKLRDSTPPAERPPASLAFDLQDAQAVIAPAQALAARHKSNAGLLVQHCVGRAREFSVKVADDATFGPTISFGAGGTTPNPADRAVDLPPLNLPLAKALIRRCRGGAMLGLPLRDHPPLSSDAIAQVLVRISQLIVDFPEIAVLETPSLFVDADGVLAVDAWIRLRRADEPPGRLAIAPYPVELTEHCLFAVDRITIRPIRPEDATAHTAFFSRLSAEDIRYRFFSAMRQLSPEMTARLTQVDYDREMAFVAVNDATAETVGVARLACDPDGEAGEFAVIVQADMKGRGVASELMRRLIDWARSRGLQQVVGQILANNHPMLAFVRHLGFSLHRLPDDPEIIEATLGL